MIFLFYQNLVFFFSFFFLFNSKLQYLLVFFYT